jgi:hypothetical protein
MMGKGRHQATDGRVPPAPWPRGRAVLAVALIGLITAGLGTAACGGPNQAERDAVAASRVRADQARAIARQAGLGADVGDFFARAAGASGERYTVVYDSGAGQQTKVISRPPDRQVDIQGAAGADSLDRIITKAGKSFSCHRGGGHWTCQAAGPAAASGAFTPDAMAQTISALVQLGGSYDFTVSHRSIVGQDATCLAADLHAGQRTNPSIGDHATLCIASASGVILEVDGTGIPLRAISYQKSIPSDAFVVPASVP